MADASRLPETVQPERYHVHLRARPDDAGFEGKVTMDLTVAEATDTIVLHAKDLEIDEAVANWEAAAGAGVAARAELDEEDERLALSLPEPVPAGPATLEITYRGPVRQDMSGLYLSEDGDERCLATQCEATDARAIFPCFDEPSFKARLKWTVTTDPMQTVLANGPLVARREDPSQGVATWEFAETPPIASYLAAIAIGNFASTKEETARDVPFRVWALGGREEHGRHANRFSTRLLPWFADYFDVEYPYAKYDQVAVPSFSFGAMENVGLVVFRASLLLMDPQTASWRQQKAVDRVVAHEFAHMWFGNLVTMAWWDDLWLNEAFAEWIANKVVDELEPDHQVWFEFQRRSSQAMDTDALDTTHAIYHPVDTPEEAMEMFDAITYGKGSTVMRMLEAFLTPKAFRAGLRTYMEAFAEDNARGDDLWEHLGQASKHPVDAIAQSWIGQPGHPLVEVAIEPGETGVRVELTQQRFRTSAEAGPDQATWHLPLVLRYEDDDGFHEHRHLMTEAQETVRLGLEGELAWLYANADDVGFYRTAPDQDQLEALSEHLDRLRPAERIGLIRDQWDLVRAGRRPVTGFLDLLEKVAADEEHFAVVEHLVGQVCDLERFLEMRDDDAGVEALRAWTRGTFGPALDDLGATGGVQEDPPTRQRRASLLQAVAGIGQDQGAIEAALEVAEQERASPGQVDPDLASTAITVAAHHGDRRTFEEHLRTYKTRRASQAPPQEVDRYLLSFPAFRGIQLVEWTLEMLGDGSVPKQSVGPLLTRMLAEPHSQRLAFDHVRDNWTWIQENLGGAWVGRIVEASGQMPPSHRKEVVAFYEQELGEMAQQAFSRATERLEERAELHARVGDELSAWFRKRV